MFNIHGVDREITVPAEVEMSADHWTATVHFTVPYAKWGMKNPSTLFLHVNDSVEIDLMACRKRGQTTDRQLGSRSHAYRRSVTILRDDSFPFRALVAAARRKILIFFCSSARPIDDHAFDAVPLFQAKGHGKFGLRQVTGPSLHHSRLRQAAGKDAHPRADSVTV